MAKRLSDTDKWKDPFFREMSPIAKIVWIYLLDNCDHAGIWIADYGLLSFQIGFEVSEEHLTKWFGDNVLLYREGRVFIPYFITSQYGYNLERSGNKGAASAAKILASEGIVFGSNSSFQVSSDSKGSEPYAKGWPTLIKIKKKLKLKKEGESEGKPTRADFEKLYENSYPLKKGRKKGIERCLVGVHTWDEYRSLERAIEAYKAILKREQTEARYIKQFSTFMGCWTDYLDENAGSCTLPKQSDSLSVLASELLAETGTTKLES